MATVWEDSFQVMWNVSPHESTYVGINRSILMTTFWGFPGGSAVKNPLVSAGDMGSASGSGWSPRENGNPLQYSCHTPQGCNELDMLWWLKNNRKDHIWLVGINKCLSHVPRHLLLMYLPLSFGIISFPSLVSEYKNTV